MTDPQWLQLPPAERVADRLADLLFGADEILDFLQDERANSLRWIEPEIQRLYKDVDALTNDPEVTVFDARTGARAKQIETRRAGFRPPPGRAEARPTCLQ